MGGDYIRNIFFREDNEYMFVIKKRLNTLYGILYEKCKVGKYDKKHRVYKIKKEQITSEEYKKIKTLVEIIKVTEKTE